MSTPIIDSARLQSAVDDLARIGARPDGGVSRLAFSAKDRAGRDWVQAQMRDLGLDITVDAIGNILGVMPEPSGPPVVLGSHTDTVGAAGRFDGALGVVAALEAIRVTRRSELARRLGVVSFVNEEGVRFMPDMMGSLFARGDLPLEETLQITGTDGVRIGEALEATGMAGGGAIRPADWHAFLELHIEQGPVLEREELRVGVVDGVQGLRWLRFRVQGQSNHAGTTPMAGRRDAGLVAARAAVELRAMTRRDAGLRATLGELSIAPNRINVIPGEATFSVDLRHPEAERLAAAERHVRDFVAELAARDGLSLGVESLAHAPPVQFNPRVIDAVEAAAIAADLSHRRMISGAGHDAQILAPVCPSAMVFVPSRDGISHNPAEWSSPEACADGAQVLLGAALALAAY